MTITIRDTKQVNKIVDAFYLTDGTISNEELNTINVIVISDRVIDFKYFDKSICYKKYDIVKVYCSFDDTRTILNVKCYDLGDNLDDLKLRNEIEIIK